MTEEHGPIKLPFNLAGAARGCQAGRDPPLLHIWNKSQKKAHWSNDMVSLSAPCSVFSGQIRTDCRSIA
jgi:hypothetical protein